MKGQLREHPLVELVQEISRAAIPGALRVAHERVRAVVCFEAGEVVFAASNLRAHRLAFLLRQWGTVAPERLVAAGIDALSDEQAGAALVTAGVLTAEDLARLRQRQSVESLRPPLLWTEGEWAYDPRPQTAVAAHAPLDKAQLLLEAARRLPDDFVAARMGDREDVVSPSAMLAEDQQLLPEEAFILSRLDVPVSLSELLAVGGLPEAQTLRAVYALAACGLVRRERAPTALSPELVAQARAAQAAARPAAAEPAAEQARQEAAEAEEADPLSGVETLFERAAARTHYEVLGVGRSAPPAELKRAYYALARRFHPDRFRRDADAALLARIESAFTRVAQAYEVLKDNKARAAYDAKLARERPPAPPPPAPSPFRAARGADASAGPDKKPPAEAPPDAEGLFRRGMTAHLQGDYEEAARLLGQAASVAPQQARYRAHYGRALAQSRGTRRRAESELQAAVSMEPDNVEFRVMLAELYRDIGLRRRAEGELEHALKLNPGHVPARRLLQSLRQG